MVAVAHPARHTFISGFNKVTAELFAYRVVLKEIASVKDQQSADSRSQRIRALTAP